MCAAAAINSELFHRWNKRTHTYTQTHTEKLIGIKTRRNIYLRMFCARWNPSIEPSKRGSLGSSIPIWITAVHIFPFCTVKKKQTPGYHNYHSDKAMDWMTEKSGFDSLFTVARKLWRYQTLLPILETLNQQIERFGRGSGHSLHSVLRVRMLKSFSIHSHGVLHD
jgi:hypothetical protein